MPLDNRSFTAGHFELELDGAKSTAYLKSVDGGFPKTDTVTEPVGPFHQRIKHQGPAEYEPFSCVFGLSGSNSVLGWIRNSWRNEFDRRNGQVSHADFNFEKRLEHQFYNALITETGFPALDASSKEPAYLTLKFAPENAKIAAASGGKINGNLGSKQKLWTSAAFRLNIDGIDMTHVNKIEPFTIKQAFTKLQTGEDRFPQIEPTKIEFPNLTCTMSLAHAGPLLEWHEKFVVQGQANPTAEKTGSIEFLDPSRSKVLFEIKLEEVALASIQPLASQANQVEIKRVKFELYVGRMDLAPSGLGIE